MTALRPPDMADSLPDLTAAAGELSEVEQRGRDHPNRRHLPPGGCNTVIRVRRWNPISTTYIGRAASLAWQRPGSLTRSTNRHEC